MNLKIALAQMRVYAGQPTKNFSAIESLVKQAKAAQADVIVFPELAVGGYVIGDQWTDRIWVQNLASFNEKIRTLSQGIAIVWGNVAVDESPNMTNHDGRLAKFNAAWIAQDGQWVQRENKVLPGLYIKHLQPNYRVFDEARHFLSGAEYVERKGLAKGSLLNPFILKVKGRDYRIGIEICEDLWDDHYPIPVNEIYLKQKVDVVLNLSSSPWTILKERSRQKQVKKLPGVPLVYVNKVGLENNGKNVILYDGGSFAFNHLGQLIVSANQRGDQQLIVTDLTKNDLTPEPTNKLYEMLVQGLRWFDQEVLDRKFSWVVGISGGIDSAVSTALLTEAVGAQRIYGYSLPYKFNTSQTKENAKTLAKKLGIHFQEVALEPMVQAYVNAIPNAGQNVALAENIQARARGSFLMNVAQHLNAVVINNGNKIEIAVGYATLYGDTIGAIAPLGDLTKLQIGELAAYINQKAQQEIIPSSVIPQMVNGIPTFGFMPSAELKEKQIDPMKWGYHDWLISELMTFPSLSVERILEQYIQGTFPETIQKLLAHYGIANGPAFIADLEWVLKQWKNGIFKRIQGAPIIMVSRGAFGFDYRESQMDFEPTARYRELKAIALKNNVR